ncbi:multiprotein-bridging factor 1 family protein [Streptomyces hirsutus]|uniref:helix-turn-helix domain-containing protein n=2 Tax=Streptomyces hirsutus TaxID=35620 RepID=UPI003864C4FA
MDGCAEGTSAMESGADAGAGAEGTGTDSNGEFLRCFGRQMKLLREVAGLTQAQLGGQVGYGEAQIAAVEQGRRIPKPELIDGVGRAVGARGVLSRRLGEGVELAAQLKRPSHVASLREQMRVQAAMWGAPAQPAEVFCVASRASVRARCLRLPPNN